MSDQNDYYLGMAEDEATVLAYNDGFDVVRITARDGKYYVVTRDYRTDRMNFKIKNNLIVSAYVG